MIETRDLTKKYDELFAVKSLDVKLEPGDVFGFIGPNGSGKTTTMKMLATLLNPTWGEAYVGGHSIYTHPKEIRRLIGYMPDFFGVYDDMKVIEYLEFFAAAYRIKGAERKKICDDVLTLVDLGYKREALVHAAVRAGNYREVAAQAAGVPPRTFYRWCRRGREASAGPLREFWQALLEAERAAEMGAVALVMKRARKDARHAQWWLERKFPERWGRESGLIKELLAALDRPRRTP